MTEEAPRGDDFSAAERRALEPYFSNVDRPVFALRNLPEVVKAALFARYSRSPKSLRRLFLDEFLDQVPVGAGGESAVGLARSQRLFQRVLADYGDDSVAQLGGAHVAVEGASNLLTKVIEWGRLMAYLEQSTRYIPYTDKRDGRWRYVVPAEIGGTALAGPYERCLDAAFATYAGWIERAMEYFAARLPVAEGVSAAAHRATVRAKALDSLRGLLPAATQSNVGIFASGQAYELMILRMRAHPLAEVRACAEAVLTELRAVIPSFLTRLDRPERGGVWSQYLADNAAATAAVAADLLGGERAEQRAQVSLTDFDPDGEVKVVAAALYAVSVLPDDQLQRIARGFSAEQRAAVLRAYIGERGNRRHKPGRALERTSYRFDVLSDYGAFRDLQRHRMLTLEWQRLSPRHGYVVPDAVAAMGAAAEWETVMKAGAELYARIEDAGLCEVAPYALPMAYRVRYFMEMNARAAMHVIELRTTPQGHPAYRAVCQQMHDLIRDAAGHRALAAAMHFADHSCGEEGRLAAEHASEQKRRAGGS
jgi:thymidylate synthase ThyX